LLVGKLPQAQGYAQTRPAFLAAASLYGADQVNHKVHLPAGREFAGLEADGVIAVIIGLQGQLNYLLPLQMIAADETIAPTQTTVKTIAGAAVGELNQSPGINGAAQMLAAAMVSLIQQLPVQAGIGITQNFGYFSLTVRRHDPSTPVMSSLWRQVQAELRSGRYLYRVRIPYLTGF
jgi:hypothetical protein